jgi:hypothetical protein
MAPNPNHIGYFDPEGVATTGKTVVYTDVFAFTHMLLYLAETQQDDIRIAFPLCLRGTALFWYSTELTPLERRLLSSVPVSEICTSLISRFKPPQRFNQKDALTDTQIQQIVQVVQQICFQDSAPAPAPPTLAPPSLAPAPAPAPAPALTTSPSTPILTTSSSASAGKDEEQPSTSALTTSPSTPALIKSSLLLISSLLTTSSIRSSFAIYIKGQMARLNGIG